MSCDACKGACGDGGCECCGACGGGVGLLEAPANRSGRDRVDARLGSYREFFSQAIDKVFSADTSALAGLGTRERTDPTVSLLDAWAVAADVLTFYRERLTQEGYLRTARSERSLRELAFQVGYKPRPGVAATVPLAYLLDKGAAPVVIPAGAKCQSVPRPGEQMQTFETDEPLEARAEWSKLQPQRERVPAISRADALLRRSLTLQGATLAVRPGERVLFVFAERIGMQVAREVASSTADVERGVTEVVLKPRIGLHEELAAKLIDLLDGSIKDGKSPLATRTLTSYLLGGSAPDCQAMLRHVKDAAAVKQARELFEAFDKRHRDLASSTPVAGIDDVLTALRLQAEAQLLSARNLQNTLLAGLQAEGAQRGALLRALSPGLGDKLYQAWRGLPATARDPETDSPAIHLLRATHAAYAPSSPGELKGHGVISAWQVPGQDEQLGYLYLDSVNDAIVPDSYGLVESPVQLEGDSGERMIEFVRIDGAKVVARSSYGFTVRVSRIELAREQDFVQEGSISMQVLSNRIYSVQSEAVTLAGEGIGDEIFGATVILDGLYEDLRAGRWVIIAGERTDVVIESKQPDNTESRTAKPHVAGLRDAELALVAGVEQMADASSPGSPRLTVLVLDKPLAYRYRRSTVTVYGNVVKATHGETVSEVLGSGDARIGNQQFALKRPPLTFVPAVSTSGVAGTQIVRVNQTRWRQVESLLDAGAEERVYQLDANAGGSAVISFGDGLHGARLTSGQENIRATYRVGIGKPGNVIAEQISLLATRPHGVQGIINPLRASGGAERDGTESIRNGIPLAVRALSPRSRLVSVEDYGVFARRFAAIGHAHATRLLDAGRSWVHVTVAGVDDLPLETGSPLIAVLKQSFRQFGDPGLPIVLEVRERLALLLQARVAISQDADWDVIEPQLRARLLDVFSPARRGLGRDAYASEAVAAMHSVPAVEWVDLDVFGALSEQALSDSGLLAAAVSQLQAQGVQDRVACLPARLAEVPGDERFLPAQMAFLVPDAPATLVLNLVPGGRP